MGDWKSYNVSYMCVFTQTVYAKTPEEAAEVASSMCKYDIDGTYPAHVVDIETEEEWDI